MTDFLNSIQSPLILDGATGSLLQQKGFKSHPTMWTNYVNFKFPNEIIEIHKSYINAGCEIITTNTFRTNPLALEQSGFDIDVGKAVRETVNLAKIAKDNKNVLLAGSNAPAEDCYSEIRTLSKYKLEENHKRHIDLLYENNVEFILNETQSHLDEILIICKHCSSQNIPFIISLFVKDDLTILSGENISDIAELILSFNPLTIMFNCIKENTFKKIITNVNLKFNWGYYLNLGSGNFDDENILCDISGDEYKNVVRETLSMKNKPKIIGACCGSNPDHIKAIKETIDENFNT